MKDRIPQYPGRVQLTPVAGMTNIYDLLRADQPTEAGMPLNKASLGFSWPLISATAP